MTLHAAIDQYIRWRQARGAGFVSAASTLRSYARFVGDALDCDEVRDGLADAFIAAGRPGSRYHANKYCLLAGFYRYALTRGLATRSPLPPEAPNEPASASPYIYSRDELRCLLAATETYQKRRRLLEPRTFRCLLLLLYGAGLRVAEALRLTQADVDIRAAVLTVRETKFNRTRCVPLAARLARSLADFSAGRQNQSAAPLALDAPFFANRDGSELKRNTVERHFRDLRLVAGVSREPAARYQPRLHDLRHSSAVHRLTAWYRQGQDVQRLLPLLSTYLGHAHLRGTQAYLSMTPELLHEAALRFEHYVGSADGGGHD